MKLKNAMSKLLTNRMVLYVVFALTLLNFIGYLMYGNLNLALGLLLIGGLTSFFTKNMTIILLVPLIVISLFASSGNSIEGMDNNTTPTTMSTATNGTSPTVSDEVKEIITDTVTEKKEDVIPANSKETEKKNGDKNKPEESFEVGRGKKKYDLDYASTVEDAYAELNKIIGGDGIQRLTADTQNLMKQQLQLAEAMKSMGPLIENMKPIMDSMGPLLNQANAFSNMGK